jgi:hypothetical protein
MSQQLSITLQRFNDKIKVMNQSRSKDMTMTADEARNLHAEVFSLLTQIAELSAQSNTTSDEEVLINMDGGRW